MKKLRHIMPSILILFYSAFSFSQNESRIGGVYKFENILFTKTLTLQKNGTFTYQLLGDIGVTQIHGNWQQRDSFIILDSNPQKERLLVNEVYNKKRKTTIIRIKEKNGSFFLGSISIITEKGDSILNLNVIEKIELKEKVSTFWITSTQGIISPLYKVSSKWTNEFNIIFENSRIFENEYWPIINQNETRPRENDGQLSKYTLKKENAEKQQRKSKTF